VTSEREHPRYAHEASVTLHLGTKTIEGRTRNVSRGGLCADLADPVEVGVDLDVDLVLVFEDDAQSEPLRLPARVAWCTPLDDAHQVGLSFRVLDRDTAEYLTMFLRFLDDGRAPKSQRAADIDDRFR
jgi:hypothetical protein